ncbi:MARVEL-like domain-containing protein, partial [Paucibacter sp. DJ4R-1]|nr:MARVEL-like domain-containing protein [Paucibacter sp. DJ4R-1]
MATTGTVSETKRGVAPPSTSKGSLLDAFLRVVLLAASVAAVVVMVTSKENKVFQVQVPGVGILGVSKPAKFNYSPAFIYLVAALSASGLYSIITGLASLSVAWKPSISPKWPLILIAHDVIILGIVASATGTAGGVAYIGLKGNSHVNWGKIC